MMKKYIFILFPMTYLLNGASVSLVIKNPGIYKIGLGISADPTDANDAIIKITASNVVVDLQGRTLEQKKDNFISGFDGIVVNPNLSNITIQNGVIRCLTGRGIVINAGCNEVTIDNVTTFSCDTGGIHVLGETSNKVRNFDIQNSRVLKCCQGTSAEFPVFVQHASGFRITNCRNNENGVLGHNISTVRVDNCTAARIFDTRANSNIGDTLVRGFHFSEVTDLLVFGCFTRNNKPLLENGESIGFDLISSATCEKNIFQDCISFVNTATTTGSKVVAFHIGIGNDKNTFERCKAVDNESHGDIIGFHCESADENAFIECVARGNESTSGLARGFFAESGSMNKFVRCFATEQVSTTTIAVGIDLDTETKSIVQKCFITRNVGVDTSHSFGVRQTVGTKNVFIKNVSSHNGETAENQFKGLQSTQVNLQSAETINSITEPWTNVGIT